MKPSNPYSDLPSHHFWKSGVVETDPAKLQTLYTKKFPLQPTDTIAAAGSCFAQRISHHLKLHKYRVADYEPKPAHISAEQATVHGYNLYSARFGNIYTVQQLLQLAEESSGTLTHPAAVWQNGDRFYDALRPGIQPGGFESADAVISERQHHLTQVKKMLCEMDVFVFTLGLTEAWRHRQSGTVYPVAPGVIAGEFDEDLYEFVNFSLAENKTALQKFVSCVTSMRGKQQPDFKLILTVSPVPLTATASGNHVLRATTYSKAVLRTLAEELWMENDYIDYFPSYEIITNQMAKGCYYQANGRSIEDAGVEAVMELFFSQHANPSAEGLKPGDQVTLRDHCDEVLLDAFAPSAEPRTTNSSAGSILFFGNSHLASVKRHWSDGSANTRLGREACFLASNWLDAPWTQLTEHDYLRKPRVTTEFASHYSLPESFPLADTTTLVLVGLTVMGDGILRAFGELHAGSPGMSDGRQITPTLPKLDNDQSSHIKKRLEKYYQGHFEVIQALCNKQAFRSIVIVESPDMTEHSARFRLGDDFVDSGSYWHYKRIAHSVVESFTHTLGIQLIGHPQHLLGEFGFSRDEYATTDKAYDIHVCPDYYASALDEVEQFIQSGGVSGHVSSIKLSTGSSGPGKLGLVATNLVTAIDRLGLDRLGLKKRR